MSALAEPVKIANAPYRLSTPFNAVTDLNIFEYSEHFPVENARLLREGKLDVALIPAFEFIEHGGYVGLDFGVGLKQPCRVPLLCGNDRMERIHTVYMHEGACSTSLLLRVLLRNHWRTTPRLVSCSSTISLSELGAGEAALLLDEGGRLDEGSFNLMLDLGEVWSSLTNLPFVPWIWAARPGLLKRNHFRKLNELFHRGARAFSNEPGFEPFQYYLNDNLKEGLEYFIRQAADLSFIPSGCYQEATFKLLDQKAKGDLELAPLGDVLSKSLQGQRLNFQNSVRLAEQGSIEDLSLAADGVRSRLSVERSISRCVAINACPERPVDKVVSELDYLVEPGIAEVKLDHTLLNGEHFDYYCELLSALRQRSRLKFEGFSVYEVVGTARELRISSQEIVARLVAAGLTSFSTDGGEMLVSPDAPRGVANLGEEWIRMSRWLHHYGGSSRAAIRFSSEDSWEKRLLHLYRLRSFQDHVPGIRELTLQSEVELDDSVELQRDWLKLAAIVRLFMDNVQRVSVELRASSDINEVLALSVGASHVRLPASNSIQKVSALVHHLAEIGLGFEEAILPEPTPLEIH